jgi:hypothetical protein
MAGKMDTGSSLGENKGKTLAFCEKQIPRFAQDDNEL